ncbi:MAG TPA: methyltransferase domain-containing protein, partial [Tepidisphaeraceae bacterium]
MSLPETIPVWNRIAAFWDQHIQEGNDFQQKLIMPTTDRLLGDVTGKAMLDACCGNGNYARRLAARGAVVTAFDGSSVFIEKAIARTPLDAKISYSVIDATDDDALLALGEKTFDSVVCS